ncbi:hypothetical protein [Stenotrophomonas rhizophila]|uniref:hypothetical protein n=1 Tax=Stenotrophomonas rhizophila TaxID=216778 RepID=UPI0011CDEE3C|nr:hypothetical protein [Stenotrophomonas rhizophila]
MALVDLKRLRAAGAGAAATARLLGSRRLEQGRQEGTGDAGNPNEHPAKDGEDDEYYNCQDQILHEHKLSAVIVR